MARAASKSRSTQPGFARSGSGCIRTKHSRLLLLAARQFGLGRFEVPQGFLPLGLQASGDKPIVGVHGHAMAFGAALFIGCARPRGAIARERHYDLLRAFQRPRARLQRQAASAREKRADDCLVDLHGADVKTIASTAFGDVSSRAVIARRSSSAGVVSAQFAPAIATDGETLQKRAAFSHRAAPRGVRPWTRISGNARAIGFICGPIDVAFMVVLNEHPPFGNR